MNRRTLTQCPLCGSEWAVKHSTCTDAYVSGETFDLYSCPSCQFIYTQSPPVEEEIGAYYQSPDYVSHTDTRRGLMHSLYHYARLYMLRRKAHLLCRLKPYDRPRLLDIGCGTGYFAHAMQERGWEVEAIEREPSAREFARNRFQLEVMPAESLWTLPPQRFDVITLWHVMEHLEPLHQVWDQLHQSLNEQGVLVVAVPNASSFDARHYGADWAAYDVPRHLWHFTPSTLHRLAQQHGFTLAEHHPMPLDAFYISMLSERHRGSRLAFVKGLYVGIKAWMHTLISKEQSSSMIYIFRKKETNR